VNAQWESQPWEPVPGQEMHRLDPDSNPDSRNASLDRPSTMALSFDSAISTRRWSAVLRQHGATSPTTRPSVLRARMHKPRSPSQRVARTRRRYEKSQVGQHTGVTSVSVGPRSPAAG
jgi:hypothetical protein